jgi:hypothetical protein
MIRQSPHVQVGLLEAVEVPRVAQDRVEAVCVVLDGGMKLDVAQLSQVGATHWWPKLKVAQLFEMLKVHLGP